MSAPRVGTAQGADQRASKSYRRDIDGLRALAVLPIVLFHLGFGRASGGYVGVDIFFVISGYLIGGIVLRQIDNGTYSVLNFYTRRFRRIVPALVAMLVATTIAMYFMAFPGPMASYGSSLVAAMLSISNIYFWETTSYFAPAAETQPLLHTWSLAVEEQFYIVFPLLMLLARRRHRAAMLTVIGLLTLASASANIALIRVQPTATFFLLPTRLWELLFGVVAVATRSAWLSRRTVRETIAMVGLALIIMPILFYKPTTLFPGVAAIPPCLGTALLLCTGANGKTLVGHALSLRPLVFFGLISYSLYLWHWPIIVLLKQGLPLLHLPPQWKVIAFGLSILLGWVSWRLIERPWRNPSISPRTIFFWSGASAAVVSAAGWMLVALHGVPGRFSPDVVRLAAVADDASPNDFRIGKCFISSSYSFSDFDPAQCLMRIDAKRNVLIMGDSHAGHLWSGLAERYPEVNFEQATASGCRPLLPSDNKGEIRCTELMAYLFETYLPTAKLDAVILSGNWQQDDLEAVGAVLEWFRSHGIKVILSGPIVRYDAALPLILALALQRHQPALIERSRTADIDVLDTEFAGLANAHNVTYFSAYKALCDARKCQTLDDAGVPIQFDNAHLTHAGSVILAGRFPMEAATKSY
jgi:peptidoglycan/LPS O-acetylase OafA/YrhL